MALNRKITPSRSASVKNLFSKAVSSAKETEEELSQLEADIRKLKIEFEQFFGGGKSRPPADTEWRIEQVIKRYGDRGAEMTYNQRFRYSNLCQTYAKYKEIFHKRLRRREEGTVDRHYGAAARAIQAERARTQKPKEGPASPPPPPLAVRCGDPAREPRKVDQIYRAFRQALEYSGQSVEKLSPAAFEQFLRSKVEQLRKQKGSDDVEVVVSVERGKAILKARIKS